MISGSTMASGDIGSKPTFLRADTIGSPGIRRESTSPRDPAVQAAGLSAGYAGLQVLSDCSFSVDPGQLVAVIGPNGAGKSTLLKLLTGSMPPWSGSLTIFGTSVDHARKGGVIAYMPQHEQLDWDYPMTVADVVLTGRLALIRRRGGWRSMLPMAFQTDADRQAASGALDAVGLSHVADRPIGALSGGQKKRALLARALTQEAALLLLDEPLAGVDQQSEAVIRSILIKERDRGRTLMMVTHDLEGITGFADRAMLIQGGIKAYGPPETLLQEIR